MSHPPSSTLAQLIAARYAAAVDVPGALAERPDLLRMLGRGACRAFAPRAVPQDVLGVLCAAAFAAPTKSDLQQRDVILIDDPDIRARLVALVPGQAWVADAPMLAVFCGNNRRQRLIHDWHNIPFANDHLDAFFNAVGDAAIALGAFVAAADAVGLGTCPISAVRNAAQEVSDLLGLPDHVFPFAGLAIGYPAHPPKVSARLPLSVTCHTNRYDEGDIAADVAAYDSARAATDPYATQRFVDTFGTSDAYGWSEDKARQYSRDERGGFGAFVRARGFVLE